MVMSCIKLGVDSPAFCVVSCRPVAASHTLTEAEQVTRYIEQEVKRNSRGLNALVAAAEETEFDSLTWRHGERIQLRVREAGEFRTVEDGDAGGVIAAAVANNVPSFSIVRYEDNWLVVFS